MRPGFCLSRSGIAVCGAWLFDPSPVWAHSPVEGIGTFYGHALHTWVSPTNALLLIGTALLLGQQTLAYARLGLAALAAGFAAGLAIAGGDLAGRPIEWSLLMGSLLVGGAVSFGRRMPGALLFATAAGAGLAIGLDSAPARADGQLLLSILGLTLGTLGAATLIVGTTLGVSRAWQQVGIRVAGSWIAAISVLALTFSLLGTTRELPVLLTGRGL